MTLKQTIEYFKNKIDNSECVEDYKQLKLWLEELDRFKTIQINDEISNHFANIGSLGCVHCDHKDEYIIDLEHENKLLKNRIKELEEYLDIMKKLP